MEDRKEIIEELNDVLEKNYDSLNGYRKAAEDARDNLLMGYLNKQVLIRKEFIDELTTEVRALGGEPKTSGTAQGVMHRAWIDFKTALSLEKDEDVIEECIRGEKNCIEEYNDFLEESNVPVSTRTLLTKQKSIIEKVLVELEVKEEEYDD